MINYHPLFFSPFLSSCFYSRTFDYIFSLLWFKTPDSKTKSVLVFNSVLVALVPQMAAGLCGRRTVAAVGSGGVGRTPLLHPC